MPDDLPNADPDVKALAAREGAAGYDTQIALFFGEDLLEEDQPTEIIGGDFGARARRRAYGRSWSMPPPFWR